MTKKLSRVGKSYSSLIDRNLMQLLNIDPLVVSPIKEDKEQVRKVFQSSMEKYINVYKKLAQ